MHITKFKSSQIIGMLKHYNREHITQNIDTTKTQFNVSAFNTYFENCKNAKEINSKINEIINKRVKRKVRPDAVKMLDLIITQPKNIENTKGLNYNEDFFNKCLDSFEKRYINNDNAIGFNIHCDEQGQPHLHYYFIPLIKTEKGDKLSARDYLGITDKAIINLNTLHDNIIKDTGYNELINDNGIIKNLTMKEYQLKQDIEKQKERIENLDQNKNDMKQLENQKQIELENQKSINIEKEKELSAEKEKTAILLDYIEKQKNINTILPSKYKENLKKYDNYIRDLKDIENRVNQIELPKEQLLKFADNIRPMTNYNAKAEVYADENNKAKIEIKADDSLTERIEKNGADLEQLSNEFNLDITALESSAKEIENNAKATLKNVAPKAENTKPKNFINKLFNRDGR